MIPPPRWTSHELQAALEQARSLFRAERIKEPLEAYLAAFDRYQGSVENLLRRSADLAGLDEAASDLLTDPQQLEAFRYLSGPPMSEDDLKTLSEAALSPKRLRATPSMVRSILDIVQTGLDRRRFPWVADGREPTDNERNAAVVASAALMAVSRVAAMRRNEGKDIQEQLVEAALSGAGLRKVTPRAIPTLHKAPEAGAFCRECLLGERKADFAVGLWDSRVLAIECKVSNSSTNSVKRLNNDAAAKAEIWIRDFGTRQIVPAAVLSGVYKVHNLENAQNRGLTLFWAHELDQLVNWIGKTKV